MKVLKSFEIIGYDGNIISNHSITAQVGLSLISTLNEWDAQSSGKTLHESGETNRCHGGLITFSYHRGMFCLISESNDTAFKNSLFKLFYSGLSQLQDIGVTSVILFMTQLSYWKFGDDVFDSIVSSIQTLEKDSVKQDAQPIELTIIVPGAHFNRAVKITTTLMEAEGNV